MEAKVPTFTQIMSAFSDEMRLKIIELAIKDDVHPDDLSRRLDTSRTNVYKHLEILQETLFITKIEHPDGKIYYHLTQQGHAAYQKWKQTYEEYIKGTLKIEALPPPITPKPELKPPAERPPEVSKPNLLSQAVEKVNIRLAFIIIETVLFLTGTYWVTSSILAVAAGYSPLALVGGIFIALTFWTLMFLVYALYKRYVE